MYCSKCGTENAETNKYCRACRENLGVITQAVEQRLPFILTRRPNQSSDRRSERIRRDSVSAFLLGFLFLALGFFGYKYRPFYGVILLGISCYFIFSGVCSYWDFRRSLEPDFDRETLSEEAPDMESVDKRELITLGSENIARPLDKRNS